MTQTVGPHEVPELLDNVFGIRTDPGKARLLETRLRELDSAQHRPGPTPKADLIGTGPDTFRRVAEAALGKIRSKTDSGSRPRRCVQGSGDVHRASARPRPAISAGR